MKIQTDNSTDIGSYIVMGVNTRTEEAQSCRYYKSYTNALADATKLWESSPNYGTQYLVVEVQGRVRAQNIPQVQTKLTEKL